MVGTATLLAVTQLPAMSWILPAVMTVFQSSAPLTIYGEPEVGSVPFLLTIWLRAALSVALRFSVKAVADVISTSAVSVST